MQTHFFEEAQGKEPRRSYRERIVVRPGSSRARHFCRVKIRVKHHKRNYCTTFVTEATVKTSDSYQKESVMTYLSLPLGLMLLAASSYAAPIGAARNSDPVTTESSRATAPSQDDRRQSHTPPRPVSGVSTTPPHQVVRAAWEWSNEERIASRANPALARVRVAESAVPQASRAIAANALQRPIVDIIDGKRQPELFLPTELFDTLVRDGLINGNTWREFYSKPVRSAGLPRDFWAQLDRVVGSYAAELRAQNDARYAPQSDDRATDARQATALCTQRFDALQRARGEFGEALDRLLYSYVARKTTLISDQPASAQQLTMESRGCR